MFATIQYDAQHKEKKQTLRNNIKNNKIMCLVYKIKNRMKIIYES